MSRAALVVNPTKLDDDEALRESVRRFMDDHGWDEPLWLETTPDDPGRATLTRRCPPGSTSCSPADAARIGLTP